MEPLIINNIKTNYLIDENGNIYNKKTKKFLNGSIKKNGYKSVKLTIDGIKKDYLVHRLVALTYLENPDNFPQVNHKDRNKLNNNITNLEWINASDNISHTFITGRNKRQSILPIQEDIINNSDWKQYMNTNYYFCKDGRGANLKTGKYLNPSEMGNGYLRYSLYIDQKKINILAHILIYSLFSDDKIDNTKQINHKDGNKKNNNINNLEQISRSKNIQHSYYTLKQNTQKIQQYSLDGILIKEYQSISEAARINDFNISGISLASSGKIKTYKHYIWKKV